MFKLWQCYNSLGTGCSRKSSKLMTFPEGIMAACQILVCGAGWLHRAGAVAEDGAHWYPAQGGWLKWQESHLFLLSSLACKELKLNLGGKWVERENCKAIASNMEVVRGDDLSVTPRGHMVSHSILGKCARLYFYFFIEPHSPNPTV